MSDTTTLGPCFCGHDAVAHGRCVCSEPRECTDHLGLCEWCGCSIYEEARPPADLDVAVPMRDAYDSTPTTQSEES